MSCYCAFILRVCNTLDEKEKEMPSTSPIWEEALSSRLETIVPASQDTFLGYIAGIVRKQLDLNDCMELSTD